MIKWIKNYFTNRKPPKNPYEGEPPSPDGAEGEPLVDYAEPDPGAGDWETTSDRSFSDGEISVDPLDSVKVYDLRGEQPDPPSPVRGKNKWRVRRGRVVRRTPRTVTGICVHQTAARFGVSDRAVAEANGDRELALARRAKGVACHVMAFADGFVSWPNPLDWYVWHGNAFNADTLGIEIDGDFAGLMDDPTTAFRKKDNPDTLTPELELAAKRAIKLLVEEGRKMGMPIKYIYAHRQSSPTRRSDPGEEIWKKIVLDYAVKELGLETRPALIKRKGYTIPKQWDSEGLGDYWDDPRR